jgi:hypothetical protein
MGVDLVGNLDFYNNHNEINYLESILGKTLVFAGAFQFA